MAEDKQKTSQISNVAASKVGAELGKKVAVRAAGAAAGAASGGIGYVAAEVGSRVATFANKHKGDIAKMATGLGVGLVALPAAVIGAMLSAAATIGSALVLAVGALVASVVFMFFMINNSALVVPPGTSLIGGQGYVPGIAVGASCPIPGGRLIVGPYGHTTGDAGYGHGMDEYWAGIGGDCRDYRISGCYARQPGDDCYDEKGGCSTYGLAIDISYPSLAAGNVYLPYIKGESVVWVPTTPNPPSAGFLRTVHDGDVYEMYLAHLNAIPLGGPSGSVTGTLDPNASPPHVHIEIMINASWADPLSMCSGGAVTPTGLPECSSVGGSCISAPSCASQGRYNYANQGSCTAKGPSFVCCGGPIIPVEDEPCIQAGGSCITDQELRLLTFPRDATCENANMSTIQASCSTGKTCCRPTTAQQTCDAVGGSCFSDLEISLLSPPGTTNPTCETARMTTEQGTCTTGTTCCRVP